MHNRKVVNKKSDQKKTDKIRRKNQRRFRSRLSPSQRKGAAFTVSLLAFIVLVSMIATPRNKVDSAKNMTLEEKKIVASKSIFKDPPKVQKDYGKCNVRKGIVPNYPIQSTFTASYPGSGAKMTWKLIEALTGLVTGDDFQLNGHSNIVSIKTHYPSSEGRQITGAELIPRAMLLIRNPLHSIPSYFNFVYEYENNLPGHSTKAPLEEWIKWRNNNFDRQVQVWRRHTEYWMGAYDKLHRRVISYEKLIDDELGPAEAMKIAEFLNRSDGVTTVAPEEVPCVWNAVIKYKKQASRRRLSDGNLMEDQHRMLSSSSYTIGGELQDYSSPSKSKSSLQDSYGSFESSTSQSSQYSKPLFDQVSSTTKEGNNNYSTSYTSSKEKKVQPSKSYTTSTTAKSSQYATSGEVQPSKSYTTSTTAKSSQYATSGEEPSKYQTKQKQSYSSKYLRKESQPTTVSATRQYDETSSSLEAAKISSSSSSQYKSFEQEEEEESKKGFTNYYSQYQKVKPTIDTIGSGQYKSSSSAKSTQYGTATKPKKHTSAQSKRSYASTYYNDPAEQAKSSSTTKDDTEQASNYAGYSSEGETKDLAKGKLRGSQTAKSSYLEKTDYSRPKVKKESEKSGDLSEKRTEYREVEEEEEEKKEKNVQPPKEEKKDEIQSKRGGPKYIAPYNPQQLKDLIGVLTQLLERYRDDKDLAPILVSFIDEAVRRSEGPPEDENTIVVET